MYEWTIRFGVPGRIVVDGGGENKGVVTELLARYNIRNIPIAAYHPQSNGLVERGHQRIIDSVLN